MSWVHAITLSGEEATTDFGRKLAPLLRAGDVVLLSGPVGAGKSTLARAIIRTCLASPDEDVPSPSFTLVQTYEAPDLTIWHVDLYRLDGPDAVLELGLDAAMGSALCLIEWPDRLGSWTPAGTLLCDLSPRPGAVDLSLSGPAPWPDRLEPLL